MTIRKIMTCLAGFFTALAVNAQISVDAPKVVGGDEQFNITFSMSEKPDNFDWNAGEDFQIVWGPQKGSSTSVSIVNGTRTSKSSYTFTYIIIPLHSGTFTLPAAHAVVDGRDVYSRAARIEVVSNGSSQAQQPQSQDNQQPKEEARPSSSQATPAADVFMRLSPSKTNVVKGEPITVSLKLYVRGAVSGIEDAHFPTFNGFWSQEVESPQQISFQRESVGDKIYESALLRKWILIPQSSGDLKIESADMSLLIAQRVSSGNSVFDSFFDDVRNVKKRVTTQPVTIKVSPLPAGAPASFTGAVGNFTIRAMLTRDSLRVNDATSLVVTVSGKGNLSLVTAPKINFPLDSEVYDTKSTENYEPGCGGTAGSKSFEYPFIPRSHGDFEIPPVEFSYYDIAHRKYVTVTAPALPYHVGAAAPGGYQGGNLTTMGTGNSQTGVKSLNEDIRYITTKLPKLSQKRTFLAGKPVFWIMYLLLAVLGAVVYLAVSRMRAVRSDVVLVKTRGASKLARKRLSSADSFLNRNLYGAFYEELHKALLGYASDKLNIPAAELSKDGIRAAFLRAGAPQSLVDDYMVLLEECEFARFAPDAANEKMHNAYDRALNVITSIDANMKKEKSSRSMLTICLLCALAFMGQNMEALAQEEETVEPVCVDSLWNSAVAAYGARQYALAAELFTQIEKQGICGKELYTNIADSYLKAGNKGPAILYYERALKIDPSFKDASYNLAIANSMIQDRIEKVPELILKTWCRNLCFKLSSDVWTIMSWIFFALTVGLTLLFFLARETVTRRAGFFSAIVALLLSLCCAFNATWQKRMADSDDAAIVVRSVSAVKSSPSAMSQDQFILHEGTRVRILDVVGEWDNISIADGREGWIMSKDIEVI